jgi:hypothetical protein
MRAGEDDFRRAQIAPCEPCGYASDGVIVQVIDASSNPIRLPRGQWFHAAWHRYSPTFSRVCQ